MLKSSDLLDVRQVLRKLSEGQSLDIDEAYEIAKLMLEGKLNDIEIAAILTALKVRGERPEEIAGFVKAMRESCVKIPVQEYLDKLIDTAGTGGDGFSTINVSTVAAILTAACGGYVLKHGNRAMSGKSGSADFMEALGYKIDHGPEQVRKMIEKTRFGFAFAQLYHPLLKNVAHIRRTLGFRTIFNLVGPLSNPGGVKKQILGVAKLELLEVYAKVGQLLEFKRLIVLHGEPGIDEASICGKTFVVEIRNGKVEQYSIMPEEVGLTRGDIKELQVTNPEDSVRKTLEALKPNSEPSSIKKFIMLNTAFALYCADIVKDVRDGVELARQVIDDGVALDYIKTIVEASRQV